MLCLKRRNVPPVPVTPLSIFHLCCFWKQKLNRMIYNEVQRLPLRDIVTLWSYAFLPSCSLVLSPTLRKDLLSVFRDVEFGPALTMKWLEQGCVSVIGVLPRMWPIRTAPYWSPHPVRSHCHPRSPQQTPHNTSFPPQPPYGKNAPTSAQQKIETTKDLRPERLRWHRWKLTYITVDYANTLAHRKQLIWYIY